MKYTGCDPIYREKVIVTHAELPQVKMLLRKAAQGDAAIVIAVDRLPRDTIDLLVIAREREKAGAGLRSIAGPLIDATWSA